MNRITLPDLTRENQLAKIVVNASFKIHQALGAGLLESAYEECLHYELLKEKIFVERQKVLPLVYEEIQLESGYRIDILVENKLVIEIKSVENLNNLHTAQILIYLKLSKCKLGLLINFNTPLFKDGIKRFINNPL